MAVAAVGAAWARAERSTLLLFSQSKTALSRTTERLAATVVMLGSEEEGEDCRELAVRDAFTPAAAAAVRVAMAANASGKCSWEGAVAAVGRLLQALTLQAPAVGV